MFTVLHPNQVLFFERDGRKVLINDQMSLADAKFINEQYPGVYVHIHAAPLAPDPLATAPVATEPVTTAPATSGRAKSGQTPKTA